VRRKGKGFYNGVQRHALQPQAAPFVSEVVDGAVTPRPSDDADNFRLWFV
jgi:hypothetical protein